MNEIWTKNTTKKGVTYTLRFHYGRSEKGAYLWKKITAKTKMEARQKRDQFEIRMGTASRNVIIKQSFLSYLSIWGEVYYKNSVKEQTYVGFINALNSRIKPYCISNVEVSNIGVDLLQRYICELTDFGYSRDTICKTWRYIKNCLKYGMDKGELQEIKLDLIKLPNENNVKKREKKVLPFSLNDVAKIEKESAALVGKNKKYYYGDVILFLLNTGLRIGEAMALTWSDIDLQNGYITVNKNSANIQDKTETAVKKTKEIIGSTKTKSSERRVVINNTVRRILNDFKNKNAGHCEHTDRVILSSKFTVPSRRNISRCLKAITENADAELKTSSLHVLRHTYATMFLRKGVPISFISKQLGHANETTTRNIYISYLDETFRQDKEFFEKF